LSQKLVFESENFDPKINYFKSAIFVDWKMPIDDLRIRNLTVEAETDWRYCFPTVNTHAERSAINGAKGTIFKTCQKTFYEKMDTKM